MLTPKLSHTGLMKTLPKVTKAQTGVTKSGGIFKAITALQKRGAQSSNVKILELQQRNFLLRLINSGQAGWANDINAKGSSCLVEKRFGIRIIGLDGLAVKRMTEVQYKTVAFPLATFKNHLTTSGEGLRPHMYKDSTGHVTIGVGHMIPDAAHAISLNAGPLPFHWQAGKGKGTVTDAHIADDYNKVLAVSGNNYKAKFYKTVTRLKVTRAAVLALLDRDANQFLNEVRGSSSFPGFDAYPVEAQQAIVDMAFNLGVPKLNGFSNFVRAVKQRDWKTAAAESSRKHVQTDRNAETAGLLLAALASDQTKNKFFISTNPVAGGKRLNVTIKPDGKLILIEGKATP